MTKLSHCSALAILPNEEYFDKINEIRSKHDKAYPRWMPHINILYPFIPENQFEQVRTKLKPKLCNMNSFEIELNTIGYFPQGKQATVHLKPSPNSNLDELFNQIREALPDVEYKHNEFNPHLTIAQCKKNEVEELMNNLRNDWLGDGFKFTIQNISLLVRDEVDKNIPFSLHSVEELN